MIPNSQVKNNLNQSGYLLVGLTALLPVVLIVAMGFAAFADLAFIKGELTEFCIDQSEHIQSDSKTALMALLKLNPLAQSLKILEDGIKAQIVLAITGLPKTAAWLAHLELKRKNIHNHRESLDSVQKKIIQMNKNKVQVEGNILKNRLYQKIVELKKSRAFEEIQWILSKSSYNGWPIEPSFQEIAPVYRLSRNFQENQKSVTFVKINLKRDKVWSSFVLGKLGLDIMCGASLKKENEKWQIVTIADKY